MNAVLLIAAAVAFVAGCVLVSRLVRGGRSQEMQRVLVAQGLVFHAASPPFPEVERDRMVRFTRRRGCACRNVAHGILNGEDLVFFEHRARNGGLESIVGFRLPAPEFELILLRHAVNPAVMAPVFSLVGMAVVHFPEDEPFSRQYLLIGKDERALRRVFSPALRALFCPPPGQRRWACESSGGWLLIFRPDRLIRPADCARFVDDAAKVAAAIRGECDKLAGALPVAEAEKKSAMATLPEAPKPAVQGR